MISEIFDDKKYFVCQVATIARPPVDPAHKRPSTDYTGYIICIYQVRILAADWRISCCVFSILTPDWLQVFKGDDGEKFERNWLYWTGIQYTCYTCRDLTRVPQEPGCCTKTCPATWA